MVADRTSELVKLNRKLSQEIRIRDRVQKEQDRLIAAIENTADSIVITDEKPLIMYVNPAFEKITGYTAEEVLGKDPKILQSGLHDTQFYADFWKTISSGQVWTGRFKNKNKQGCIIEEDSTISSIKDKDGKVVNYVAVNRDITKELELERQLQQVSKLESIGTLAAGIAHEINTPVQYVRDNTKFLEEAIRDLSNLDELHQTLVNSVSNKELFPDEIAKIEEMAEEIDLEFLNEETNKAVNSALEGLDRISSIVQAMKEFSHPGGNGKQPEDLNELIKSTVTVSRNEWKHHAELRFEPDSSLPPVSMISGQLKQVILNLIINAAHAIAEETGAQAAEKGTIIITTRHEKSHARVTVKDTGAGIPDTILEKIFDPFFTTKEVGQGTGQGLALAFKTIVEGHSGALDVKSEVGVGTEFILTLPL